MLPLKFFLRDCTLRLQFFIFPFPDGWSTWRFSPHHIIQATTIEVCLLVEMNVPKEIDHGKAALSRNKFKLFFHTGIFGISLFLPFLLFNLAKQTVERVSVSSIDEIDNPNKSFNLLYNTFRL